MRTFWGKVAQVCRGQIFILSLSRQCQSVEGSFCFYYVFLSVCDCFQCCDVIYFTSGTASGVKKIEYCYWHALYLELGHRGVTDLQMASLTQLSIKTQINHSANCAMACPPPRSGCILASALAYGIMPFACCDLCNLFCSVYCT